MKPRKTRIRSRSFTRVLPSFMIGGQGVFYLCLVFSFVLFGFSVLKPQSLSGVRVGVGDMVSPVLSTVTRPIQILVETVSNVSGLSELKAENAQLKAENIRLKEWYQTALMLQAENKSLQGLLNLEKTPDHNFVTARVISDAGNAYVKTLLVKSGTDSGIEKNQAVLSDGGMIGRVIEAGDKTARVLLLTDVNSRLPILIEGSNQKAILAGDNTDLPLLTHLPVDSGITQGDRVITSGDGGVFYPGHPIGRIVKNQKGEFAVQLFADMGRITYVRVLNKNETVDHISADAVRALK